MATPVADGAWQQQSVWIGITHAPSMVATARLIEVYMPVVMPTVTGTRATVAKRAGRTPERRSAAARWMRKDLAVVKNP